MISVRNHPQPLNGNKILLFLFCVSLLVVTSCGTKKKTSTVLKSPDYEKVEEEEKEIEEEKEVVEEEEEVIDNKIALLLPFQLQKIRVESIGKEDIRRSALALDFYQGLHIGLQELADKGNRFLLDVLDTKDDDIQNQTLAQSEGVVEASLVIGPVFPNEIKAFGRSFGNKKTLQISPLAASLPSEFMLPNLVTLTPSINSHANALAKKIEERAKTDDVIILLDVGDSKSKQYISQVKSKLESENKLFIKTVNKIEDLTESLEDESVNHVICGSNDDFVISILMNTLESEYLEEDKNIQLYGHPLWAKMNFRSYDYFSAYNPIITSESHLNENSTAARKFASAYKKEYSVEPSETAYKGYDSAIYFGSLLKKHGDNIEEKITKSDFKGLYSDYSFDFNQSWGYENRSVSYKTFKNGSFQ